jgi:hypothetical protein
MGGAMQGELERGDADRIGYKRPVRGALEPTAHGNRDAGIDRGAGSGTRPHHMRSPRCAFISISC